MQRDHSQFTAALLRENIDRAHREDELVVGDHRGSSAPRIERRHFTRLPAAEERQRGIGTRPRLFSILKCPRMQNFADHPKPARRCSGFLIARQGQLTAFCPVCGGRSWLAGLVPIYSHKRLEVVRDVLAGLRGSQPANFFLPVGKFAKWEKRAERRDLDRRSLKIIQGWGEVPRRGAGGLT